MFQFCVLFYWVFSSVQVGNAGSSAGTVGSYVKLLVPNEDPVILNPGAAPTNVSNENCNEFSELVGTFVFFDTQATGNKGPRQLQAQSNISTYSCGSEGCNGAIDLRGNPLQTVLPVGDLTNIFASTITFFSEKNFGGGFYSYSATTSGISIPAASSIIVTGYRAWSVCTDQYTCDCVTAAVPDANPRYESKFIPNTYTLPGFTENTTQFSPVYYAWQSYKFQQIHQASNNICPPTPLKPVTDPAISPNDDH